MQLSTKIVKKKSLSDVRLQNSIQTSELIYTGSVLRPSHDRPKLHFTLHFYLSVSEASRCPGSDMLANIVLFFAFPRNNWAPVGFAGGPRGKPGGQRGTWELGSSLGDRGSAPGVLVVVLVIKLDSNFKKLKHYIVGACAATSGHLDERFKHTVSTPQSQLSTMIIIWFEMKAVIVIDNIFIGVCRYTDNLHPRSHICLS